MTSESGSVPPTTTAAVPGGPSAPASVPYTLERPGGPMPGMLARPGGPPAPPAGAPADVVGAGPPLQDGPPGSDPNGPKPAGPSANGLEPVGVPPSASPVAATAPTDAAASPSVGPAGPAQDAGARKARPAGDPLLGPNPDLMPELPPLPDAGPAAAPAAAKPPATSPSATPAPSGPTATRADDLPPLGPATGPTGSPPAQASPGGADPSAAPGPPAGGPSAPPELGPPSADNRPGGTGPAVGAGQVADLPPLEPVPSASQLSGGRVRPTAASVPSPGPARRASTHRDGQILRTSLQTSAPEAKDPEIHGSWQQASMTAAKVGDEIITIRDLHAAINDLCKRKDIPYNSLPREQKHELCVGLMKELINQSLLLQEAKRIIKDPKMYDKFTGEADRFWREDQIPQLEVEFAAENEAQLREKLKEHGRSFDTISLMTRRSWMADAFLHEKLKGKIKTELPELLKFYNEHLRDKGFDRPAQITWREIVVETGPKTTLEEARRKIEAIHQSLRQGADFAALAKSQSEGPSRSREQGGLMQTSPGSFGVASVNEALDSLPIGQASSILEGPSSFHIVRVENRRAAGPAPFEELQDEIRSKILEKKFQAERAAYLQKLRDESYVSTFLDQPESSPRRVSR
jgi:peptidyl-prolyl cis-trans isomerase SurA